MSVVKNTANRNSSGKRSKENRLIILSNYAAFVKQNSKFFKNRETSRLEFH